MPFLIFYFYLWQIGIFFVAKNLIKRINFDFIHHVTFVSYRFPSFLCLLDAPFIFGPISGGDEIPKKLKKSFDFKSRLKEYFRELDNKLVKIYPLLNLTFKKIKKDNCNFCRYSDKKYLKNIIIKFQMN